MGYQVFVDDNFGYADEDRRYRLGDFPTLEAAVATARQVVDDYLNSAWRPGMSADALYRSYREFGEDPFIVPPPGAPASGFSAWVYAQSRCAEVCQQKPANRRK